MTFYDREMKIIDLKDVCQVNISSDWHVGCTELPILANGFEGIVCSTRYT